MGFLAARTQAPLVAQSLQKPVVPFIKAVHGHPMLGSYGRPVSRQIGGSEKTRLTLSTYVDIEPPEPTYCV